MNNARFVGCWLALGLLGATGCIYPPQMLKPVDPVKTPPTSTAAHPPSGPALAPGLVAPAGYIPPVPAASGPALTSVGRGPGAGMVPGPGHIPVPGPGPFMPAGTPSEQAAFITQRLRELEDDKAALISQVAELRKELREKDHALLQASYELKDATAQIARTREDLERWKGDMEKLRGKLRAMEKDSKVTLETIIRTLEETLDRRGDLHRSLEIEDLLPPRKKGGEG